MRAGKRGWFEIKNQGDVARIDIYDEISFFGITARDFIGELQNVRASTIDLHLNSPGGDVADGTAIYNALVQHPAVVNVTVDGIAASIASVIAMAGDDIAMAAGATMMIHEPFAMVIGNAADMAKAIEMLDMFGESIAGIYAARAGGTPEEWRARMLDETWYTAQAAVDAGIADRVLASKAAKNAFDLSVFRHPPTEEADPPVDTGFHAGPPDGGSDEWKAVARQRVVAAMEEMAHAYAH